MGRKLYIFDKDGTICQSKSGQKFINSVDDQELIPDVAERIASLKAAGHKIAIASNQGGVAFGFMSYRAARDIMRHAGELIKADYSIFCPYHPEGTVEKYKISTLLRKPGPMMIYELMAHLDFYNESRVIYIGDRPEDQQAADNAGVKFVWAWEFFGRPEPKPEWDPWEASDRLSHGHK